jgi:hypothetical protein
MAVRSQTRQIVRNPISKQSQKRAGGVAQGVDPEFKLQYCQKNKKIHPATAQPLGMAIIKTVEKNKWGAGYREVGTFLHC